MAKTLLEEKKLFRKQTDSFKFAPSNPGSRFAPKRVPSKDENGRLKIIIDGERDIYQMIQASADSCDINIIIKKFLNTGDVSLLNKGNAFYGDFSDCPQSYADWLMLAQKATNEFNKLPVDVRAKFNHNADEFIAAIGKPEWYDKLGLAKDVNPEVPVNNVVDTPVVSE